MPPKKPAAAPEAPAPTTTIRVFQSDQHRIKVYAAVNKIDMQDAVKLAVDLLLGEKKRGA